MTLEDIKNNLHNPESKLECFWCSSLISRSANFVALASEAGIITIRNRKNQVVPMIFCCSDCMLYDSTIRYQDRVARGAFRKEFNSKYENAGQLPSNWVEKSSSGSPLIK